MNKHILYSIPLAGLALTSVGCPGEEAPDKIIDTFTVNTAYDLALPFVLADVDVNGDDTLICDFVVEVEPFTIGADLTGDLTSTSSYENCQLNGVDDPASNAVIETYTYTSATTIVTANSKYTIVLTGENDTNTLNCDLVGATLTCIDDDAAQWIFTAQ